MPIVTIGLHLNLLTCKRHTPDLKSHSLELLRVLDLDLPPQTNPTQQGESVYLTVIALHVYNWDGVDQQVCVWSVAITSRKYTHSFHTCAQARLGASHTNTIDWCSHCQLQSSSLYVCCRKLWFQEELWGWVNGAKIFDWWLSKW